MKQTAILLSLSFFISIGVHAQIDKEQLALSVSKADEANLEKLKDYIWKRKTEVKIDDVTKLTTVSEFSFDEKGELQTQLIDADTDVKKKPGVRGNMQEKAAEDKLDYVQKALEIAVAYSFMTKGELMDFFSKATVTEKDGIIEATAENVKIKGDKLTVLVDSKTKLYIKKTFSSKLDKDPIGGVLNYDKFSNGVNHGTTTALDLPAQKMKLFSKNENYTERVK